MIKVFFIALFLMLNCVYVKAEIIGSNYFGRNLELEFMKLSGWQNEFGFREKKSAFLPTLKKFNDQFEFECVKGADASLSARASHHADLSIRYCDASIVIEMLDTMEKNLKNFHSNDPLMSQIIAQSQINHSLKNIDGKQYDTYQFRAFAIGHGIGVAYFTITTSPNSKHAVMSWMVFAQDEKHCLAEVFCKFDEDIMKKFNQLVLNNEESLLKPHLNEFKRHLAYPMVMAQWQKMRRLRELVKESRSFDLASQKYPEIDSEKALQYSDFAGQLNKQKDGTYRMYLIMLIQPGNNELSKEVIEDAKNIVLTNFDSYMIRYLESIVTTSE